MRDVFTGVVVKTLEGLAGVVGDVSVFLTYNRLKSYVAFFIALAVTWYLIPHLSHIAHRLNLLDCPDKPRKIHAHPMPLVGGIAMALGFMASAIFVLPFTGFRGFFAGCIILLISGFLDDFREVGHKWKFVAQIVAAWFVVFYSQLVINSFGNLLPDIPVNPGRFAIPVTIFCIVGVINAINLIDGLDGLAGGISAISLISFGVLSYINQQKEITYICIALFGAILGFLRYNWHPARVFMGDAGSLFLGFSLAYISIAVTQAPKSIVPPIVPLLILAVPIVDTVIMLSRRLLAGRHPFAADKSHIHHVIQRFGLSRMHTTFVLLMLSLLFSCLAIVGVLLRIPEHYLFSLLISYAVLCFTSSFFIKKALRFRKKIKAPSSK